MDTPTPIPTEELYIDLTSPLCKYPVLNEVLAVKDLDPMEYCMGLRRGGLMEFIRSRLSKACLRIDLVELMTRDKWALVPETRILEPMLKGLFDNYDQGNVGRVRFDELTPVQPLYTYRLFFDPGLTITGPTGEACISGETLVSAPLHPCFSLHPAMRYFVSSVAHRPEGEGALRFYLRFSFLVKRKGVPWTWCVGEGEGEGRFRERGPPLVFDDRGEERRGREGGLEDVIERMRVEDERERERERERESGACA